LERIPVVKHTWAKYAHHIGFYSETKGNVIVKFCWPEGAREKVEKIVLMTSIDSVWPIMAHEVHDLMGLNVV
jgi:hypothetical protein